MKEEKKGQEPVFPQSGWVLERCGEINFDPMGMSKRFYAATNAMQGLLSTKNSDEHFDRILIKEIVTKSYEIADELLRQENE